MIPNQHCWYQSKACKPSATINDQKFQRQKNKLSNYTLHWLTFTQHLDNVKSQHEQSKLVGPK